MRRDLRRVAGKNDDVVVGGECGLRDHQSVSGAALIGLQDEIDARVSHDRADALGFVTDDDEDVRGRYDAAGGRDNSGQQRLAADLMQNLGQLRLEPRAFACGHYGDRDAGDGDGGSFGRRCALGFLHSPQYTLSRKSTEEGWRVRGQVAISPGAD